MHRVVRFLEKVYFGYDENQFYMRLDFTGGLPKLPSGVSVRLRFLSPQDCRLTLERVDGKWDCSAFTSPAPDHSPEVAGGKILEIGIPLKALGIEGHGEVRFFVALCEKDQEVERFPSTGFLAVPVAPRGLDEQEWMV